MPYDERNPPYALEATPESSLQFFLTRTPGPDKCVLTLRHHGKTSDNLAFTVKTTQPRRYLVRPSKGIIAPYGTQTVAILLVEKDKQFLMQSYDRLGQSALDNSKDKFLVQSCAAPDDLALEYREEKEKVHAGSYVTSKKMEEKLVSFWAKVSSSGVCLYNKKLGVRHVAEELDVFGKVPLESEKPSIPSDEIVSSDVLEVTPESALQFVLNHTKAPTGKSSSDVGATQCTMTLRHSGKSNRHFAFTVKTTQPRRYLVRPNKGIVAPNDTQTVAILLKEEDRKDLMQSYDRLGQPALDNSRDKFLVQSCAAPNDLALEYREEKGKMQTTSDGFIHSKEIDQKLMSFWAKASSGENSVHNKKLGVSHVVEKTTFSAFYKKLLEKDSRNIHFKIQELTNLVEDIHEMKFLYTLVNTFHHIGDVNGEERRDYITRSLKKIATTTECTESVVMFKQLIEKALYDGAIDDYTAKCLDREAEVTHTSHAPFVKHIWSHISLLETRMDRLESHVDNLDSRVERLEKVTSDVVVAMQKLQKGILRQKKADAAVGMMTAILNAVSFGMAGSAAEGLIGTAVNNIVDFGDLSHIQRVVDSFQDVTVKESFVAGLQAAEIYGDNAVYKAAEEGSEILRGPLYDKLLGAAKEGNPLFAITVVASTISSAHTNVEHDADLQSREEKAAKTHSLSFSSLPKNLSDATTEEICKWLSKHGVSKGSLEVIRREEIDGIFLFLEPINDVKSALRDEGVKLGQLSRICKLIEEAKGEGSLV